MKTTKTSTYQKLVRLARRLGGQVECCQESELRYYGRFDSSWVSKKYGMRGWSTAPFCDGIGVYWSRKLIVHRETGFTCAGLIHEMGHVFACKQSPNHRDCDETDFLGWEISLAQRMGVKDSWMREMGSYGVHTWEDGSLAVDDEIGDFSEIKQLTNKQRQQLFLSAVAHSQKLGSLGSKGQIHSLRKAAS